MGLEYGLLGVIALGILGRLTVTVAVLSHLLADALTLAGVRPFEPRDDREICFDVARAANPLANSGLLLLGGVVAFIGRAFAAAIAG